MTVQNTQIEVRTHRERAMQHAALSLLVPGVGQVAQGRFGAAFVQFGTVIAYFVAGLGFQSARAGLFALGWATWSVVDAYRHEPD